MNLLKTLEAGLTSKKKDLMRLLERIMSQMSQKLLSSTPRRVVSVRICNSLIVP
ncbi:MAG: hypothetical protein R3E08_13185 [Thiotrichaceae bacterium]